MSGLNGRDPMTGKFTAGNACAKVRRRIRVDVPPPVHLKPHPGVVAVWPLLTGLAAQGNPQAIKAVSDLALGFTKPDRVGPVDAEADFEEEDGEELEDDFEDKIANTLEGMSPAQRNVLRRVLRRAPEYGEGDYV